MPQLAKGGKWVFGWAVVQPDRSLIVPPEAWQEYGYTAGEELIFIRGSRTSGGFTLATPRLLAGTPISLVSEPRVLGCGRIATDGRVSLPDGVDLSPGDRLLVVRGSGRALGFYRQGPIIEEALKHPEVEVFDR